MAPTPSPRTLQSYQTPPSKTPQSKHRIHLPNPKNGGNPLSVTPTEHPVEVVGRIRDHPDRKEKSSSSSALEISGDGHSLRVRSDAGYRNFSLDGVSLSESEDLEHFYERFVESRVEGVRSGAKCTIMMYGPTGSGKSHTMFGCGRQPGIVYRALRDILGEGDRDPGVDDAGFGLTLFVQATVLEIYNEEIYDLLSGGNANGAAGAGVALPKGSTPKARLEVMGRKAKNASYITGNEAGRISREVAKVEKRRIVKSTLCNERSSRSHCLIILDVPSVGGRLMLVDMAGSENIEQAGQAGFEAKMQTAKINQGNIALKRVVESIANGDSHVPFRDSKLTMLLQDSFEDDKSKILMILCASPDPKEMHKTIATLEYGAKAKCIVRVAHMPTPRDKLINEDSSPLLRSRIVAMNQFIYKLQMENKMKEKECDKAQRELILKEEELLRLRSKLELIEGRGTAAKEEDIKCLVDEKTRALRIELKKMEERMHQQQEELNFLRQQLEEMESSNCEQQEELNFLRRKQLEEMEMESSKCAANEDVLLHDMGGGKILKRLSEMCDGDQGMEKSMELDMGDQHPIHDVKEIKEDILSSSERNSPHSSIEESIDFGIPSFSDKAVCLSTVFEMEDEGEDREEGMEEGEVDKEIVEEGVGQKRIIDYENFACLSNCQNEDLDSLSAGVDNVKDPASARRTRIQNIFRLCGNYRELAQQVKIPTPPKRRPEDADSSPLTLRKDFALPKLGENAVSPLICTIDSEHESNENKKPKGAEAAGSMMDVYVKWETSKGYPGNLVKKFKVLRNSTLSDLRKLIETHLEEANNNQSFVFLLLSDPMGTPVLKEKEAAVPVNMLPVCSNQLYSYLACMRPTKSTVQRQNHHIPFSSLENTLQQNGMRI